MGLFDIFTGDSAKAAADQNRTLLAQNQREGNAALQSGQAGSLASLDKAGGMYAPLASKYGAGSNLYLDSLGVNGAGGNDRATQAFQAGPGYQYGVSQALDQTARQQAAMGQSLGGNTLAALSDRAGNMANQEYGNWQTKLGGLIAPEFQAVGGQAGAEAGKVPVYQGTANSIAGLGTNTANGIASQNTQQANAETAASGNIWGGLMNLGKAFASGGTSLLGGGGGGITLGGPGGPKPFS